jgi:pimeloyl-ACP methyl ester carboxylesterase
VAPRGFGLRGASSRRLRPLRVLYTVDPEDFDWTAGMGQENLEEYTAARTGERELADYLEREAAAVTGATADDLLRVWRELFCESDQRVLSGAYAEHTVRQIGRSLASGIWGWLDDDLALVADWGFELDQVAAPVYIWHGTEDQFVPVSHGDWLAGHLPDARAELRPGDGHLSITLRSYGEILDALLEG